MASSPLEDEHAPLYTVGQVAEMLAVKQAFLRRVDALEVVSPQRSAGGQRRYTRYEIPIIEQVMTMADEGITLQAIRPITPLLRHPPPLPPAPPHLPPPPPAPLSHTSF